MTIREMRKKNNLSQMELARLLNVNQTAISQWETNRTRPSVEKLILLSEIFNCEIRDLITVGQVDKRGENINEKSNI